MSASSNRVIAAAQRLSGLVFLGFVLLHLLNTALAALGPESYNEFQGLARMLYQHGLLEWFLIVIPLGVHILCGLWRIWRSRQATGRMTVARRIHRYSGILLAVVIAGHVVATRGPSLLFGVHPEFEGLAWTFQAAPGYFYPYYVLFAAAAIYHVWFGLRSMTGRTKQKRSAVGRASPILAVGAWIAVVLGILALGGVLFPVADASQSSFARLVREMFT